MTTVHFRVMYDSVSDSVASPVDIGLVSQFVTFSTEECNRDLSNSLNWDQGSVFILTNWYNLVVSVRVLLESVLSHVLSVVEDTLGGGTVGLVVHVHLETVFVVVLGVGVGDHFLDERAEEVQNGASEAGGPVSNEVTLSEGVDSEYASGIVKLVVEHGSPLESF